METPFELFYRLNKDVIDHKALKNIQEGLEKGESDGVGILVPPFNDQTVEYLTRLGYCVTYCPLEDKYRVQYIIVTEHFDPFVPKSDIELMLFEKSDQFEKAKKRVF